MLKEMLKATRVKREVTCKDKVLRIISDYSMETFKARMDCEDLLQDLKNHSFYPNYCIQ